MKTVDDITRICRQACPCYYWLSPCAGCPDEVPCDMMHLALDMILGGEY